MLTVFLFLGELSLKAFFVHYVIRIKIDPPRLNAVDQYGA